jgi:hypothetical protein
MDLVPPNVPYMSIGSLSLCVKINISCSRSFLQALKMPHSPPCEFRSVALELDKNATFQRVQRALEGGYLKNLEERQGRPYQLVLGDPMPEDQAILPEPERLKGFTVSEVSEGIHYPPPPSRATDLDMLGEKYLGSDDKGSAR